MTHSPRRRSAFFLRHGGRNKSRSGQGKHGKFKCGFQVKSSQEAKILSVDEGFEAAGLKGCVQRERLGPALVAEPQITCRPSQVTKVRVTAPIRCGWSAIDIFGSEYSMSNRIYDY